MPIRLLSDVKRLSLGGNQAVEITPAPEFGNISSIKQAFRYYFLSKKYDCILINYSDAVFFLALLKLLLPGFNCKLAVLDLFVAHPENSDRISDRLKRWGRSLCIKGIDLILLYSKKNDALCEAYGIDPNKIRYIPFKINSHEYVTNHPTSDMGYIFSGGVSRRDFTSLIEACRELPYAVKIVTPPEEQAKIHGTWFDRSNIPANVEIINDDGSIESFVSYIAQARLVVIATKKFDFASTGTSVYLISMALGKCVIISSGPTTDSILSGDSAVIVPPEDPVALKQAIQKVFTDEEYRNRIAQAGRRYALGLGGEDTFFDSVVNEITCFAGNG